MSARRVLVVDDEKHIRDLVVSYLRAEGYDVDEAETGEAALEIADRRNPDLIVLDIRLPGIDGLEVLRRIRRTSDTYVIVLSARSEETDRIVGLEVGADDYVTKPFSPRELVTRVGAVLRRGRRPGGDERALRIGELAIDADRREVSVGGRPVQLSALEFDLLATLASAPGRVFTRRQLIERVWGWDFFGDQRLVDVHIRGLRKALGDSAESPAVIGTVRGVGYKLIGGRP